MTKTEFENIVLEILLSQDREIGRNTIKLLPGELWEYYENKEIISADIDKIPAFDVYTVVSTMYRGGMIDITRRTYCPECNTKNTVGYKKFSDIPDGKKIKCDKCGTVYNGRHYCIMEYRFK